MVLSIVIQILLGIGFLVFGYQKFTSEDMKQGFKHFGYGDGFRLFTGSFEILSAILIMIGVWIESLAVIGGIMIVATMIGAIGTHLKIKDEFKNMVMPLILFILGTIVVILNWSDLF